MQLFFIPIVLLSIMLHEIGHAYAADRLGDPTPRKDGRLTLNPLKHFSLYGSVIVPIATFLFLGFPIGWAKPVTFRSDYFEPRDRDIKISMVAFAGPATNIIIALTACAGYWLSLALGLSSVLAIQLMVFTMFFNIFMTILNLLPVPPLDGSKIFAPLLPARFRHMVHFAGMRWLMVTVLAFYLLSPTLVKVAITITVWLTGNTIHIGMG